MSRTKLADRKLPDYTRREEIANMVTHIIGGAFGVIALVLCVVFAAVHRNIWGTIGGAIYGAMMIFLYTVSSVYHGLTPERPKKVMQVLDHCTIYALILGTYVPVLFTGIRENYFILFIIISVLLVAGTAVCVTFTAIDHKRYAKVSMTGYFSIGWAALLLLYPLYKVYGWEMLIWLVLGGVAYTVGIYFYAVGTKKEFSHTVFHLFILLGSVLHFIPIIKFCM